MFDYIRHLFNTPSAFRDNWLAYARNVALHTALVGFVAHLAGFIVGAVIYAAWELAQWALRRADPSDCVEDWAFVMCGALAWLTLDWRVAVIACAFMASGALWRRHADPA